ASADAAVILSEDAKTLHDLSKQLLGWEGVKQSLDTNCGDLGGELMGNLATEFQEFVEAYETKLESTGLANGYDTLKDELNTVHDIYADSVLLSLKEAEAGIEERVLARLFTLWREKAYASCRTEGTQAYLIDIHDFGQVIGKKLKPVGWRHLPQWAPYSEAEIARDLNLCATDVTLDVYPAKPRLRDDLRSQLGGGDAPGAHVQEASTASGVTSTLTLSGEVLAINCAAADEAP